MYETFGKDTRTGGLAKDDIKSYPSKTGELWQKFLDVKVPVFFRIFLLLLWRKTVMASSLQAGFPVPEFRQTFVFINRFSRPAESQIRFGLCPRLIKTFR